MPSLSAFGVEAAEADADNSSEAAQRAANLAKLAQPGPLGDRSVGNANAPVTIIEYVSLTCPNCAKFQSAALPQIKKAYIDEGKVRLVVREYPIGQVALAAALAVRCLPDKDSLKAADKLLLNQKDWETQEVERDKLYDAVKFSGLKRNKFEECLNDRNLGDAVAAIKQRGRSAGVAGTPTFFVNGKKVDGAVSFAEMRTEIEAALASQQYAAQRVAAAQ